jgi:hypothetical protein
MVKRGYMSNSDVSNEINGFGNNLMGIDTTYVSGGGLAEFICRIFSIGTSFPLAAVAVSCFAEFLFDEYWLIPVQQYCVAAAVDIDFIGIG